MLRYMAMPQPNSGIVGNTGAPAELVVMMMLRVQRGLLFRNMRKRKLNDTLARDRLERHIGPY